MTNEEKEKLVAALVECYDNPLKFVLFAFPWGEKGTALENYAEPRHWQKEILQVLGEQIQQRKFDGKHSVLPIQISIASGHGIGKSALTAWLILFIMATRPNAKGVVTANTGDQLRTKTWAELSKWLNMSLVKEMFEYSNYQGRMSLINVERPHTWRCDAMTCREENSEAFAGLHSADSTPFYIFDEASAIPEKIFEVAQGGLTDGEPMWFMFGNPTRNTGFFRETHGSRRAAWLTRQIDSRTVEGTSKELFAQWERDYGADSDFFKVRVRGEFPSAGSCQVIPNDLADNARGKHLRPETYNFMPVILGVDVARFGGDRSVIVKRQGLASWIVFERRGISVVDFADAIANQVAIHHPVAIFIDEGGVGGGVIDTLRERLGIDCQGVNFGGNPGEKQYANKRAEMWFKMRDWLSNGAAIPDSADLVADLTGCEYGYKGEQLLQLERKEDMKKRGLDSPDLADALALTFAYPVALNRENGGKREQFAAMREEDIFSY